MPSLFAVSFGSENREKEILNFLEFDPTVALILASVHFEWTIKRAILILSKSPSKSLRKKIESTYLISSNNNQNGLDEIWHQEIGIPIRNASFKKIIGNLSEILGEGGAKSLRGKIIHGNGTISKVKATESVQAYFQACSNIRKLSKREGKNLDQKLVPRK
jgi:hypothetical protein